MTNTTDYVLPAYIVQTDNEAVRNSPNTYSLRRYWRAQSGLILRATVIRRTVGVASEATIEVLTSDFRWASIAAFASITVERWAGSPNTSGIVPERELGPIADDLLRRAVAILGASRLQAVQIAGVSLPV